jgi:predicted dehydrogenase
MKKYNVGIVGCGWVAAAHIPAKEMALASLNDAVISHEAVFAADRSAELERPVKISELK